jgi:lipopolysaccharide/colanic/teichoic acid biosynthesis glycosyltransferase
MIKRAFDILMSSIGLIVLSPLIAFVAIRIKLDSEGPVFYKANRAGKNKKPFKIFKFRSMVTNADKIGGPSTSDDDPRVTKIGKWVRKYKLDEVVQLINVFIGDMSLVGPRPEVISEVELYDKKWDIIFSVRPGITDLASIEFHNEGEIIAKSGIADPHEAYRIIIQPRKLELQKEYVEKSNFLLDIKIIFNTLAAIL